MQRTPTFAATAGAGLGTADVNEDQDQPYRSGLTMLPPSAGSSR
jgi:hypothetical protein